MRTEYIYFFCSQHHKHFAKAQDLVLSALWWHQLFSACSPELHWWVLGKIKHVSVDIYALNLFIEYCWEHRWEENLFCSFTTTQASWQSSAPGTLSTMVASAVLYLSTRATLMGLQKDETRVCGYMRTESIHWALWRTLIRTEYLLFFNHTTSIWQSSAPGALRTLVTSVVLYSITQPTLMRTGKEERRVFGYIRSQFIHWALWRILMRTECFLFVHHTTSILVKLRTWCFHHSCDISCSLLVNSSSTDEAWERENTCLGKYMLWIYLLSTLENTDENSIFFVFSPHHKDFGKGQHLVLSTL